MTCAQPHARFDAEAYLEWEREQTMRYEYVAGEVFAMSGATDAHVTASLNLAVLLRTHVRGNAIRHYADYVSVLLRTHVRGSPCRVYMADMKLRVDTADAFFYPDVFVTCSESDRHLPLFKQEPVLIVEALSDSTAAYDRGHKFAMYRQLPSLLEYVLIDPASMSIDVFRREDNGHFMLYPFGANDTLTLSSIAFTTPIAAVYEDVSLTTTATLSEP